MALVLRRVAVIPRTCHKRKFIRLLRCVSHNSLSKRCFSSIREVDIVIVGGGFSGAYIAKELSKKEKFGELKIALFEQSNRIGGRLYSDDSSDDGSTKSLVENFNISGITRTRVPTAYDPDICKKEVKRELGGMRIFQEAMPNVHALVTDYGLCFTDLKLGDEDNLYSYRGNAVKKKEAKYVNVGENKCEWEGKAIQAMSDSAKEQLKADIGGELYEKPYESVYLQNHSMSDFLTDYGNATPEDIKQWFAYSGYNLYHDNIQASIYIKDGNLYGSENEYQQFVSEGFMELVNRMMNEAQGCETYYGPPDPGYPDNRNKVDVNMLCSVYDIYRSGDGKLTLSVHDRINQKNEWWRANKVIFGLTKQQILNVSGITGLISEERAGAMDSCEAIPLFKCFLHWDEPWWQKYGFKHGKTTYDDHFDEQSNQSTRQIHYYDDNNLLLYCSDGELPTTKFATKCKRLFDREGSDKGYRAMYELVKELHQRHDPNIIVPEPNWEESRHAYWIAGSHKWKTNAYVPKCQQFIQNGGDIKNGGDGSDVYFVGDAFSSLQGWTEGCVETADKVIGFMYPNLS